MSLNRGEMRKLPINNTQKSEGPKKGKIKRKPAWNDSLTDQNVYKASPNDLKQRKNLHKSKYADVVHEDLNSKFSGDKPTHNDADLISSSIYSSSKFDDILKASEQILSSSRGLHDEFTSLNRCLGFPAKTCAPNVMGNVANPSNCHIDSEQIVTEPHDLNSDCKLEEMSSLSKSSSNLNTCQQLNSDNFSKKPMDDLITKFSLLKRQWSDDSDTNHHSSSNSNTFTGFTSMLMLLLDEISEKYSQVVKDLDEEKHYREMLEKEVITQRLFIDELTADVIQLKSKVFSKQ